MSKSDKTDIQKLQQAARLLHVAHMQRNNSISDMNYYGGYGNPPYRSTHYETAKKRHDFYLGIITKLYNYIQNYEGHTG